MSQTGNDAIVHINLTRQQCCEIMAGLWFACRTTPEICRWKTRDIMEYIIAIADAVEYFDCAHAQRMAGQVAPTIQTVTAQVADGLAYYPPAMVTICKGS